jgi:hypothetical protein
MPGFGRTHTPLALLVGATVVCGALAVGAREVFFPPRFRGFGEMTAGGRVAGWVVDGREAASRPVEVQLYIDGVFVAAAAADLPRPDVVAAGQARDERCGYSFALPALAAGEHESRVYAAHAVGGGGAYRTLQQTGAALRFRVGEGGRVVAR